MLDLSTVFVPVAGLASKYVNGYLINSPWFGMVNRTDKGKKHVSAVVVAAVLSVGIAFLTGTLTEGSIQSLLTVLFNAAMTYATSVTVYEVEKNSKLPTQPQG